MNISTNITRWSARHPRTTQWLWFGGLWCGGVAAAMALASPFKLMIHFLK